jgi:hypothetical protein
MRLSDGWPLLRKIIVDGYTFNEIKSLIGQAGLPIHNLSHLQQRSGSRSASKGNLMDGVDFLFRQFAVPDQERFVRTVIHDIWEQKHESREQIADLLERIGWGITEGEPHPLELQVDVEVTAFPEEQRKLLSKAIRRFREGDLDGAVTAICSVVDSATERIYASEGLADHRSDSYQQRVSRAFATRQRVVVHSLAGGGLADVEVERIWQNLKGSVNQAAYVLAAFRREISDVHGSANASTALVQRSLDSAIFILRSLLA